MPGLATAIVKRSDSRQRLRGPAEALGGGTDLRMAGAMPQAGQGLREPYVQRACLPQIGLDPPHAAKALFKLNNFPDQLLGYFYERKKNQHKDKPKSKRIDTLEVGQCYLAYALDMPEVSKKDRARIFGDLFETVFSEELNPKELIPPLKLFREIEGKKKDLQRRIKNKEKFSDEELFLIDGAYHVLFATKLLARKSGADIFDLTSTEKFVDQAIDIVSACVAESKSSDVGFSFNRFFKDASTRTIIAGRP